MAGTQKSRTPAKKAAKVKAEVPSVKKVTAAKVAKKATPAKTAQRKSVTPASKGEATRRKVKKYSLSSRFTTFEIGDRVFFEHIHNWENDVEIIEIVGIVVDKIDDPVLGLKFIEVKFEPTEKMAWHEEATKLRRFIVK